MAIIATGRGIVILNIADNLTLVETDETYLDSKWVTSINHLGQGIFLVSDYRSYNLQILNMNAHELDTLIENPS